MILFESRTRDTQIENKGGREGGALEDWGWHIYTAMSWWATVHGVTGDMTEHAHTHV